MTDVLVWAGVAALGGVGALARFLVDGAVARRTGGGLPWGTFAVNVTGAALLGFFSGIALTGDGFVLAGTALLGSYTTFSTWMLESHRLGEGGRGWGVWLNILGSLAAGLAAVAAGREIGALL